MEPVGTSDVVVPAWEAFSRDYIETGIPCVVVVRATPYVTVFLDEGATRLGGHLEIAPTTAIPISPLEEVSFLEVLFDGRRCLELSTCRPELYRTFFFMLAEVASGAVLDGESPIASLDRSLRNWSALLRHPETLSEERQIGLFGELWLLRRLVRSLGVAALQAWTGPRRQSHDFRLAHSEFEVKTTSGSGRIHTVNGLGQLVPSTGFDLYVVSLQITHAGSGGATLAEAVEEIAAELGLGSEAERTFFELLTLSGYHSTDAPRYPRRRRLLGPSLLVPVVAGFPRLTPEAIAVIPSSFAAERIRDVTYRIDLHGLGVPDGDPRFLEVLPALPVDAGESPNV
ncbi:PD-(D/E)XK motif protein [Pararoseomonas indoligenes]|uniref:PD-(D/E)XK motif protein n=1 Tax=Roseomonas indoligenes TaxID=2820811 RepID=A0A940N2H2_9PROT|nr:PD-(D/E)XK motif protein [Pararoseomonas indoligenes]MBP0496013.1 PD-(D/E)XK motif protein [Pararoseomonas indoligenes]